MVLTPGNSHQESALLSAEDPIPSLDPRATFRAYLIRNARYALRQIQEPLTSEHLSAILQALDFALACPQAWPEARALLIALAPLMAHRNLHAVWLDMLNRGLAQAQKHGDSEGEMMLHFYLGDFLRRMDRGEEAQHHLQRALHMATDLDHRQWRVRAANRLAMLWRRQRRWTEAKNLLREVETWLKEVDMPWEEGYACLTWGALHFDQRRWQDALQALRCSVEQWTVTQDRRMKARALMNLAPVLRRLGRAEEAESYLRDAIETLSPEGDSVALGVAYMNLGVTLGEHLDRFEEALLSYRQAERIFRAFGDEFHLNMVITDIGRAFFGLERWPEAIRTLQQAVARWEAQDDLSRRINAQATLIAALCEMGEREEAWHMLAKARADAQRLPPAQRAAREDALAQVEAMMRQREDCARANAGAQR